MIQKNKNTKILITGASGLLGFNLSSMLFRLGFQSILGQYCNNHQIFEYIDGIKLDLVNTKEVINVIQKFTPDIIIHCAAMTNVDQCQQYPKEAFDSNVAACKNIIAAVAKLESKIIYLSTDQLWEGLKAFVTEKTVPHPINIYGESKLAGERVIASYTNHIILRTNFFGGDLPWRQSFIGWLESNFKSNNFFNAFDDIYFTPIGLPILANIIINIMFSNKVGTFHVGGSERLSKYEFAEKYAAFKNYNTNLIQRASAVNHPFLAKRPKDMSLNSSKIAEKLNIVLPNIQESFEALSNYSNIIH